MSGCGKLGLGTVQWGMAYGIANTDGRPGVAAVGEMLRLARDVGIEFLDTAYTYGEAESLLGKQRVASKGFRVVTKTIPLRSPEVTTQEVSAVTAAFQASLQRLNCLRVYGLLVHNADNLLAKGADLLWTALQEFKSLGEVEKVGVSVYRPQQLEDILDRYPIDIVQLPFNIYDQRFAQTGLLDRLKEVNVEVHTRSVFLQGLLLLHPDRLSGYFSSIREHQARLYDIFRESGLTPLNACLQYCLQQTHIDIVIVGCEVPRQLAEICDVSVREMSGDLSAVAEFSLQDEAFLNPSMWKN